ncbi:MAG: FAD-dependent oxidoreductase [Ginsengibacter sp.]
MDDIGFKDYKRTKSVYFSEHRSEQSFMKDEFTARKDAGFKVELLTRNDLKTEYGLKAYYAIVSEKGCVTNAYTLTHALLQHSIKKGLQVFDKTIVTNIDYKKNMELKTGEGFTIKAKHIINATGYEVVNFIQKGIVDFYCTYACVSEQAEE